MFETVGCQMSIPCHLSRVKISTSKNSYVSSRVGDGKSYGLPFFLSFAMTYNLNELGFTD